MSKDFHSPVPDCFSDLGLDSTLLKSLQKSGYLTPTPIQAEMIPHVMAGRDVVGQAQTGTGKTAAFALPMLNQLSLAKKARPQVLVLTPTRELAIQVSQSFQTYGAFLKHLNVLPVFGGQDYAIQLKQLKRGVHVVVGTPGRTMDHIRRGSLKLDAITSLVLDEADEMLKMGFQEDVEWILEQAPKERQIALFSATMPQTIRRIAKTYLDNPIEITIKDKTATAPNINQQYLITNGMKAKKEALGKILEAESFDGMLIFVRTKIQTVEIAEHLAKLGHACGPLNGDIPQNQRLRMIEQLKSGRLDIVVATDVAARGLDVERISHVINFDAPFDTESYIHRIGRTGRAGRSGKALLFLHPREKKMLKSIERKTGGRIGLMRLPTIAEINALRIATFKDRITTTLAGDCSFYTRLIEEYCQEKEMDAHHVAAALAKMVQDKTPLLLDEPKKQNRQDHKRLNGKGTRRTRTESNVQEKKFTVTLPEPGMDRYRIEIGDSHGVKPANIVGAIANEADISSEYIGRISIFNDYSTVDLPYGMPRQILRLLQKVRIRERMLQMRRDTTLPKKESRASSGEKKIRKKRAASPKQARQ